MAKFSNGQELVCLKDSQWEAGFGPKKNEIVICDGYTSPWGGYDFLYLKGYDQIMFKTRINFNDVFFSPVSDITELQELLKEEPAMA